MKKGRIRAHLQSPHVQNRPVPLPQGRGTAEAAPVSAYSYLQERGVHNVLHEAVLHEAVLREAVLREAVHRNPPHNARRGHPLVRAHTALLDPGLRKHHNEPLVDVVHLRMELRGIAHRD